MATANLDPKAPSETLDYKVNWSAEMLGFGDTIAASTWVAEDGLVVEADTFTDHTATVFLSGGIAGKYYDVVNTITTVGERVETKTLPIRCANK